MKEIYVSGAYSSLELFNKTLKYLLHFRANNVLQFTFFSRSLMQLLWRSRPNGRKNAINCLYLDQDPVSGG